MQGRRSLSTEHYMSKIVVSHKIWSIVNIFHLWTHNFVYSYIFFVFDYKIIAYIIILLKKEKKSG